MKEENKCNHEHFSRVCNTCGVDLVHQALAEERERVREYLGHYKTKSDCCSQTVDDIYTTLSSLNTNPK